MRSVSNTLYFVRGGLYHVFSHPPSRQEEKAVPARVGMGENQAAARLTPGLPGALLADDLDSLSLDHVPDAPQRLASFATENLQPVGLRWRQGDQQTTAGLGGPEEHL